MKTVRKRFPHGAEALFLPADVKGKKSGLETVSSARRSKFSGDGAAFFFRVLILSTLE
jgi:hypothetical protein